MKKKPIGFQNAVIGDETTKCVPVYKLTPEHKATKTELKDLYASKKVLEKALKAIELGLESQYKNYIHVFNDEGYDYYTRTCAVCGAYLGLI